MAIEIQEKFEVSAPIESVWEFVMDPHRIAPCLPGAKLEEVVDERNFLGRVKIKLGAITASYKGKVELTEVDVEQYTVKMLAEGRDTSGGNAKGLVTSRLRSLPDGQTEVVVGATIDLTGRVMQVGSRMIEGVSHQLFQQAAKKLKKQLEAAPPAGQPASGAADAAVTVAAEDEAEEALAVLPLLLKSLWAAIIGFFRRLFDSSAR
jgi:carbon monoxide dehydrogenase subunit G